MAGPAVTTQLTSTIATLTACCWETASLTRAQIAGIGERSRAHGEAPVLVTSCQRVEVYGVDGCDCPAPLRFAGMDALRHMAEVAAGLHSLVLGEAEILGQVRNALSAAPPAVRATGDIAIAAARDLRRQTAFNSHSGHMLDRALSYAGIEARGAALVIGAGAIGRLVALRAHELGFERVLVAGRRLPDAAWFNEGPFEFVALAGLTETPPVDVAVGCLGSAAGELDPAKDLPVVRRLVVDLGTPRNFAVTPSIPLVAIADMLDESQHRPHALARRAALREQLHAALERRLAMASETGRSPVGELRQAAEMARAREAERIRRLHPELSADTVDAITKSLVNQLLHAPSERLRALGDVPLAHQLAALFRETGNPSGDHAQLDAEDG